jgi:diguanylate cyclase (GGDEF)-like protein/PAS domain S-box-containing protein
MVEVMQSLKPGWHDMTMTARDGTRVDSSWANVRLSDGRHVGIGLDVRETRRAEVALRRSEADFRALSENSPDIIVRYDKNYRFLYVNPRAQLIFGHSRDELIGKRSVELGLPRQSAESWESVLKEIFLTKNEKTIEFDFPGSGGKRYFNSRMMPEFDEQGNVATVLSISRDITTLKEVQNKLSKVVRELKKKADTLDEQKRILETILSHIPAGVSVSAAPDGKLIFTSAYYDNYWGIPIEKIRSLPLEKRMALFSRIDMRGTVRSADEFPVIRALKRGERVMNEEWKVRRSDGTESTILISAEPLHDENGAITHAIATWTDITDRKKMEDVLRRNEYELRTLVDNSPDLIFRVDSGMRYMYVNPAYERLSGIARELFIGKTNEELGMPPQLVELWRQALTIVIESGREYGLEFEMTSLFGQRYFSARLIPEFVKSGLVETALVIARDITERKRAEEQMRYVSFHDPVTGLFNRAFFEEELHRLDIERELPICIVMGDVNNLKLSNDVFGHREGDKLLRTIADAIKKGCRKDDIVARWGGDEFTAILPRTDFETAEQICSRITHIARESADTVIEPSIALGAAIKENRDQNIYQTIRQAEKAMYNNKLAQGKQNEHNVIASILARARERTQDLTVHVARCYELVRRFGKVLELEEDQVKALLLLNEMHDIGTAVIPREIMTKPGRLSKEEWELVKKHPEVGFRIVKSLSETARISDEVLSHDEHWDGSGYPRGLKGKEIPYLARVFSIIEAYDVMTNDRPYARVLSTTDAIAELRRNAGKQFDPELVEPFIERVLQKEKVPV